jgi:hypothetical protein
MDLSIRRPIVNRSQRNGKSVWEFAISSPGRTYALLIRTDAVETAFDFGVWDMGDWIQLMTQEAFDDRAETIAEHEPLTCDACLSAIEDHEMLDTDDPMREGSDEGFVCQECRALSIDAARTKLEHLLVAVETADDAAIRVWLRRHWDAFELLFVPAVTL